MRNTVTSFGGALRVDTPESNALLEVQRSVPFNNIARLFRYYGETVYRTLGGDCLYQAHVFRQMLRAADSQVIVGLYNQSGITTDGHVMPVTYSERGTLLHEITELATQPVPLDQLPMGIGQHALVRTFPVMPGKGRLLFSKWVGDGRMLSTMLVSERNDWFGRQATLNMRKAIVLPDDADDHPFNETMARSEVDELVLHAMGDDGSKSYVALHTQTGAMEAGRIGDGGTYARFEHEAAFGAELSRVARLIGADRDTLLELFQQGWAYYRELHPEYDEPRE
ncbi:MAG TPA: hypothetical protein PKV72_00925 [Candidatus Peribacteria bacterium]|nr:hypothetical protein [Candidatus Peribacteria bacterium]